MADDHDDNDQGEDLVPRAHIRQLEEQAKKSKELEAQLAAMQRETVFARALGSTDHPARKYFEKGYDGELDIDAVRNAAKEAGLIGAQQSQPEAPQQRHDDLSAYARMAATSAGADAAGQEDLADRIRNAASQEEVMAIMTDAGYPTSWGSQ